MTKSKGTHQSDYLQITEHNLASTERCLMLSLSWEVQQCEGSPCLKSQGLRLWMRCDALLPDPAPCLPSHYVLYPQEL